MESLGKPVSRAIIADLVLGSLEGVPFYLTPKTNYGSEGSEGQHDAGWSNVRDVLVNGDGVIGRELSIWESGNNGSTDLFWDQIDN